jgi:putative glutamine amidotransferase
VLLPPTGKGIGLVDRLDGLVLSGGADIDPARYGQPPHERAGKASPERDEFELALFEQARAAALPVFAVCRGLQLVNVALGGTLVQHLPDRLEHNLEHLPTPGVFGTHRITTQDGSRVAAIVGPDLKVHCHHHQAVDKLADGLRATAFAEDGTIEAIEGMDLLGVQWHPEEDNIDDRLFAAHVDDARRYREERSA